MKYSRTPVRFQYIFVTTENDDYVETFVFLFVVNEWFNNHDDVQSNPVLLAEPVGNGTGDFSRLFPGYRYFGTHCLVSPTSLPWIQAPLLPRPR
jgi:hypothetical protein